MDGWMNRQMDRQVNGWIDEWMDGWMDGEIDFVQQKVVCVQNMHMCSVTYALIHVLGHYANSMVIVLKDMQIPMFSCFSVKDNWLQ